MSDVNNTADQTTDDGDTIADHCHESHYEKAQYDEYDYLVMVQLGSQVHAVLARLIVDNKDGFVTLKPPLCGHDRLRPGINVGGANVPCPRGLSVRKECVLAVIDAPVGS
jgi:hypothetical protein